MQVPDGVARIRVVDKREDGFHFVFTSFPAPVLGGPMSGMRVIETVYGSDGHRYGALVRVGNIVVASDGAEPDVLLDEDGCDIILVTPGVDAEKDDKILFWRFGEERLYQAIAALNAKIAEACIDYVSRKEK